VFELLRRPYRARRILPEASTTGRRPSSTART
jgi:hypothetical protein